MDAGRCRAPFVADCGRGTGAAAGSCSSSGGVELDVWVLVSAEAEASTGAAAASDLDGVRGLLVVVGAEVSAALNGLDSRLGDLLLIVMSYSMPVTIPPCVGVG